MRGGASGGGGGAGPERPPGRPPGTAAGPALAEATGALAQPCHPGPSSEGHLRKASLRKGHRRRHRPRVVCQRGPREDGHDDPPTSENWQRRGGLPTAARPPASGPCGRETPIPALLVSVLPVTGAATMALWVTAGILQRSLTPEHHILMQKNERFSISTAARLYKETATVMFCFFSFFPEPHYHNISP